MDTLLCVCKSMYVHVDEAIQTKTEGPADYDAVQPSTVAKGLKALGTDADVIVSSD